MEEEKKSKLGKLSKVIYIFAGIGKVLTIIGMVGIVIAMIVVPVCTSNIKVDKKTETIKVFGEKIKYERSSSEVKLTYDKETTTLTKKDEVSGMNLVLDYLEDSDLNKVTLVAETLFAFTIGTLVLAFLKLKNVNKLFKNIHNEETPFTEENANLARNIAKFMLYSFILAIVANMALGLMTDDKLSYSFNVGSIIYMLVAFSLYYIFDYGYKLETKSEK